MDSLTSQLQYSGLSFQIATLRVFSLGFSVTIGIPFNVLSVEVSTATSGRPKVLDFRFVLDPCQSFLTTEEALQDQAQINTNQLSISLNHFMCLNQSESSAFLQHFCNTVAPACDCPCRGIQSWRCDVLRLGKSWDGGPDYSPTI